MSGLIITENLAFWGNVIGFVAAASKTVFDLVINPRLFKKEESTIGLMEAATRKRARGDTSTAWTFLVVGIGYAFSILALIKVN